MRITYDNNLIDKIYPDPSKIKLLAKNETLRFKVIFKKDPFEQAKKI